MKHIFKWLIDYFPRSIVYVKEAVSPWVAKSAVVLVFLFYFLPSQAQIHMPDMLVPNDTWGLIDANNLYGGCMQVETHAALLAMDVQFLKRGMMFVVVDDEPGVTGAQPKMYLFLPPKGVWNYYSPFTIPAALQNKTIADIPNLYKYLIPLNTSSNTYSATKSNVYYDTASNQFYRYDDVTSSYILIVPAASNISVIAQNGIASTNVQSALEELNSKISTNALRFETSVLVDGEVNYPVGFALEANSLVFYNGVLLDYPTQWTTGATTSDLRLLVATLVFDKIKIQK